MRALLVGSVVKVESEPWDFNGRQGVTHAYFVRESGDEVSSAQKIKCRDKSDLPREGDTVTARVNVSAQENDRGGARLSVTHLEFLEKVPAAPLHAVSGD